MDTSPTPSWSPIPSPQVALRKWWSASVVAPFFFFFFWLNSFMGHSPLSVIPAPVSAVCSCLGSALLQPVLGCHLLRLFFSPFPVLLCSCICAEQSLALSHTVQNPPYQNPVSLAQYAGGKGCECVCNFAIFLASLTHPKGRQILFSGLIIFTVTKTTESQPWEVVDIMATKITLESW